MSKTKFFFFFYFFSVYVTGAVFGFSPVNSSLLQCLRLHFSNPKTEHLLESSSLKFIEIMPTGTSMPLKVQLEHGTFAIFKPLSSSFDSRHEVAAYRVDRLLELGLVPATVMKEFQGVKGSLQFFIEGTRDPYTAGATISQNMKFLDLLIANTDRSAENFLVLKDGRQLAIDHDLAFRTLDGTPGEWIISKSIPDLKVFKRLKEVPDALWHLELDPLLGPTKVTKFLQRRDYLIRRMETLLTEK